MTAESQIEFVLGERYAIWDEASRIIGEFVGWYQGLPEFRPLVWEGQEAEPLRNICAGPRANVRPVNSHPRARTPPSLVSPQRLPPRAQ